MKNIIEIFAAQIKIAGDKISSAIKDTITILSPQTEKTLNPKIKKLNLNLKRHLKRHLKRPKRHLKIPEYILKSKEEIQGGLRVSRGSGGLKC